MKVEKMDLKNGGCEECDRVEYIFQDKDSLDIKYSYEDIYIVEIGDEVHKLCEKCLRQLKTNIENIMDKSDIDFPKYKADSNKKEGSIINKKITFASCTEKYGIEPLNFSSRVFNALCNSGIFTVFQLEELTEEDLLKIKNLGKNSIEEIKKKLNRIEKSLKDSYNK